MQNSLTNKSWSNIAATPAVFTLPGGMYGVTCMAGTWGGGSVTLQRLAPDNSTYATCLTSFGANGYQSAYLPSGTYKLLVATATGIYADLVGIAETP